MKLSFVLCFIFSQSLWARTFNEKSSGGEIRKAIRQQGFVIFDSLVDEESLDGLAAASRDLIKKVPRAQIKGFLELYHHQAWANIRQNKKLYQAFAKIWGEEELWVIFDRIIYSHHKHIQTHLPLHVDQNPHHGTGFSSLQGLLALEEMNATTGRLGLIPKSQNWFSSYKKWSNEHQGWIAYKGKDLSQLWNRVLPINLKKGQLVVWDSRVTHTRVQSISSDQPWERLLAMISYFPAKNDPALSVLRQEAFEKGCGIYDHFAGLRKTGHAPKIYLRTNKEKLTTLGEKLYGMKSW